MLKNLLAFIALCSTCISSHAQYIRTHSLCYNGSEAYTDSVAYYYTGQQQDSMVVYHADDWTTFQIIHKEWMEYDANGWLIQHVYIDMMDGVVTYMWQETLVNDAQGHVLQITMQTHNGTEWVNTNQTLNTYDGNGILSLQLNQYWDVSQWIDSYKTEYENDSEGHISSEGFYFYLDIWNAENTATYTYTDGLLTLVEYFDLSKQPYAKEEYSYDELEQLTAFIHFTWAFNAWFNNDTFYEYDMYGNMTHEYWGHLEYQSGNSQYVDDGGCFHYYQQVIVQTDELYMASPLLVFPNPATEMITIELSAAAAIWITNADGKQILQQVLPSGQSQLDISHLAKGVYYLSVSNAVHVQTTRLVVR
ncbi:MAG: T9SS type A sorting domain-containing protein [Flavobacteriales bacterium]